MNHTERRGGAAKVGLAAICAAWFKDVGLQGESGGLAGILQQDYASMVAFLKECFGAVVTPGVITTVAEAEQAAGEFRQAHVDAVVLVHIMWSEDQPLITLLEECKSFPLVLWHYHPSGHLPRHLTTDDLFRCSGTVGALQGSAVLQKLGVTPLFASGTPGDSALRQALHQLDQALAIRRDFQGMAAGRIAGMCAVMTGTRVDEQALRERLGVHLIEISAQEYASACQAVTTERAQAYAAEIRARYVVDGVSTASLALACRNTLALDDLVQRYNLGVVAIQDLDVELHRLVGIRPCLCPPESARRGVAFGMESDLHATLGLLAAMKAAEAPGMYTEVFTFDSRENLLLMGHAGVHDPRLASDEGVTIVPDYEYRHSDEYEGAWQEFILAPGPVTCVSLYDTGHGYRLTAFEGESVAGPKKLQGFAHALVRPDIHVDLLLPGLLRLGLTQHFAVAPGRITDILAKWCQVSEVEWVHLGEKGSR